MASTGNLIVDIKMGPGLQLMLKLLTVLPDSVRQQDDSWEQCWEELSSKAQDDVKQVREEVHLFLENEKVLEISSDNR